MRVKYPKTMHLPWSPGLQNDDRLIQSLDGFAGQEVVVTEKMDGENTTLYFDHLHARSLDGRHHPSRDWVKRFHGSVKYLIPEDLRICGENVYAEHSIHYDGLESYFLGFSAWINDEWGDTCLNWDETVAWFDEIGITSVPVLWRGQWEDFPRDFANSLLERCDEVEGYVVRTTNAFPMEEFQQRVAKYVRKNHVQTDQHWMQKAVVPNGLAR